MKRFKIQYRLFAALLLLALGAIPAAHAQSTGVGIGTTTPDASAALDVSATSKGLLVPRMDSAHRVGIAAPATGLLVYQTNGVTPGFYYWTATGWMVLTTPQIASTYFTTNISFEDNGMAGTFYFDPTRLSPSDAIEFSGGNHMAISLGTGGGLTQKNFTTITEACKIIKLKMIVENISNAVTDVTTATVYVNGVATPMSVSVTISTGKAVGIYATTPVSLAAGDRVSIAWSESNVNPYNLSTIQLVFQ